jgi:hypothetical protein
MTLCFNLQRLSKQSIGLFGNNCVQCNAPSLDSLCQQQQEITSWSSGLHSRFVFVRVRVNISARRPDMLTVVIRGFSQTLHSNAWIVS